MASQSEKVALFRSQYRIDPFYCQPGIGGAHERAGWKATSTDSAATIWPRSLKWTPWRS